MTLLRNTVTISFISYKKEGGAQLLEEKRYLINELAKQANTTVRTIRYYTSEGLLPQPITDGKYAYYEENHLRRLELILQMKEAYLPLKEIRQIMLSLSDEEVKLRLTEQVLPDKKNEVDNTPLTIRQSNESDALNYISNLMETQSKYRSNEIQSRKTPQPVQFPDRNFQIPLPISPHDVENWQRIILAPGVEMHLQYPTDSDTSHRIQQLISYAKKIFIKS
ncbi:MAG: MerR family transcriptional regulator [Anaerolineaceae bacterium]|nr:MerR family transcriptional regulator [Anaerolineaceae bacterium]